jgi:hypothetical protein
MNVSDRSQFMTVFELFWSQTAENASRFKSERITVLCSLIHNYFSNIKRADNVRDLEKLNEEWYAQIILNGMFGVDTFFLMR